MPSPWWSANLTHSDGKVHNVLIVATENDSVYALDANDPTAGPRHNGVLWQDSFIDPANGITTVPSQDVENNGVGPTYGITATPVIDRATKTIYVVSQVKEQPTDAGGPHYVQQFHALNLVNGKEMDGGPVTVGDTTLHPDGSFTNDTARLRPRHRRRVGRRGGQVQRAAAAPPDGPGARHARCRGIPTASSSRALPRMAISTRTTAGSSASTRRP